MSHCSKLGPSTAHSFDDLEHRLARRAVAACADRVAEHLLLVSENREAGDSHELSLPRRDALAAEHRSVGHVDHELGKDRVERGDLGDEAIARAAVDRVEVGRSAATSKLFVWLRRVVVRSWRAAVGELIREPKQGLQSARKSAVRDALHEKLANLVGRHASFAQAPTARDEHVAIRTAYGCEGEDSQTRQGFESTSKEQGIDRMHPVSLSRTFSIPRGGLAAALFLLVGSGLASCGSAAVEKAPDAEPTVRFIRDPIRIDGVERTLRRVDFHRAVVKEVAQDWLRVLAVEAHIGELIRDSGAAEPEVKRVVELMARVEAEPQLQKHFPRFPKNSKGVPASCAFRLATCLARLEVLLEEVCDETDELVARIDDAVAYFSPTVTETGAWCHGATVDAREVWPALLARTDVAWREARVRKILTPEG